MTINLRKQKGVSRLGLLMTFIVLACALTIGLKVMPVYVDHNFVAGVAEDIAESGQLSGMTQEDVRGEIASSLRINNIHDFDLSDIRLVREDGEPRIDIEYQRQVHLFYNVDVLLSFDESF